MDTVFIHNLIAHPVVGAFEWEQRIQQKVIINLEMQTDVRKSSTHDSLDKALDYKLVAQQVKKFIEKSRFALLETMAEKTAEFVLNEFTTKWVRVRLDKPFAVRGAGTVGVTIERGNKK